KKMVTKTSLTKTQNTDTTFLKSQANSSANTEVATANDNEMLPMEQPTITTAANHNNKQPYKIQNARHSHFRHKSKAA
ncbi:MAG: hypothetical protein H7257_01365, partial [Taibaiella sp.]|nr:hypothetical protein [Taibaiella sp.]